MCSSGTQLRARNMSVHFDASRGRYAVRRREQGRHRIRRFGSEAEALRFEHGLTSQAAGELGSLEARLAELESRPRCWSRAGSAARGC
jgi:hypothetical protein